MAATWKKILTESDVPAATDPGGAALLHVMASVNGATAWSVQDIFDATAAANITTSAGTAGTSLLASHRDHTHGIAANAVTLANLATQAANTVLANATVGAAVPSAVAITEQHLLGRVTGGNIAEVDIGIGDDDILQVDGTLEDNDFCYATANGIEGKTAAETAALLTTLATDIELHYVKILSWIGV